MKATKYSLLVTIAKIIETHGGNYSYAGQTKYLELLEGKHEAKIGRRMLNYHMADLEADGLIKRVRRTHRNEDGTISLLTTAICITVKGCRMLAMKGVKWAWAHMKKLAKKYIPAPEGAGMYKAGASEQDVGRQDDGLKSQIGAAKKLGLTLYEHLRGLQQGRR